MKKLCEYLEKRGISPTIQRLKIFKYIEEILKHPTVDMIYQEISKEIPTLSKTTIYNTMKLFVEKGIVSELCVGEGEVRYEINLAPHGHFRCTECGNIFDIELDPKIFKIKKVDGNQIIYTSVYFTGKCRECLNKKGRINE